MSKTTHTPGPWFINKRAAMFIECAHRGIASCTGADNRSPDNLEAENKANARLIAAAPDLLAACKAALAALSQPMTYPADIEAAKKWLTDAAAKAEGRA